MFDEKMDGSIENIRQGYLFSYAQMIFNQFKRLSIIESDKEEPEGFRKYTHEYEKESEILECKILCILTTALFLESYIFDFCARKKSSTYFKKYLDKLDPVAKWIITTKVLLQEGLNENDEIVGRLTRLYKTRNELVHHKTKSSKDFMKPPEFPKELEPIKCIKLIKDLLEKLMVLDNSEVFANFVLKHFRSWFKYANMDTRFYPIIWEA